LGQLRESHEEFKKLGYQIIALSPDRPEKVQVTSRAPQKPDYTLLSDAQLDAARAFGVAWQVDPEMVDLLLEYNIDIEDASGEKHHWLPVPSVFLLDTDGKVLFHYVNPDYKVRIDGDVLLAAARAYAE